MNDVIRTDECIVNLHGVTYWLLSKQEAMAMITIGPIPHISSIEVARNMSRDVFKIYIRLTESDHPESVEATHGRRWLLRIDCED